MFEQIKLQQSVNWGFTRAETVPLWGVWIGIEMLHLPVEPRGQKSDRLSGLNSCMFFAHHLSEMGTITARSRERRPVTVIPSLFALVASTT